MSSGRSNKRKKFKKLKIRIPIGKPTRIHSEKGYKRDKNKNWKNDKNQEVFEK